MRTAHYSWSQTPQKHSFDEGNPVLPDYFCIVFLSTSLCISISLPLSLFMRTPFALLSLFSRRALLDKQEFVDAADAFQRAQASAPDQEATRAISTL
jgi:hypothetical protein